MRSDSPRSSGIAWCAVALALSLAAGRARAQDVSVGCWNGLVCNTDRAVPPLPCSTGTDCPSSLCLEGTCLPPLADCQYCFDGLPSYCPDLFLADEPTPVRGALDALAGTCSYSFCGTIGYVVRPSAGPSIRGLEACFQMGGGWRLWGQGDCDSDGIPNELDGPRLCVPGRVAGRERAAYVCADATFLAVGRDPGPMPPCAGPMPPLVAPELAACARDSASFEPFGMCCERREDCPVLRGPWGVVRPVRCVALGPDVGVCAYDGPSDLADDTSCLTHAPTPSCLTDAASPAFERWAMGDCDAECEEAETVNLVAPEVCTCSPPMPDAGIDAHVEPDGYVEPDARASELDAAVPDGGEAFDAAPSPEAPPSFGGAGCRCVAHGRRASGHSLVGVLVALGVLVRSRRRIIGR